MKRKVLLFVGLAVIFVASVYFATRPAISELVMLLAGTPAICSLLGALFVLLRDEIAYERKQALLESQHTFVAGVTSHMASVAFDKHAEFCEEYVAKVIEATTALFRKGPHQEAMDYGAELYRIRKRWQVWLTPETDAALEPFEFALRKIGADAMLLKDAGQFQQRHAMVERLYALYAKVLGIEDKEKREESTGEAVAEIVQRLRNVLGISELTALRSKLVKRAYDSLDV